MRFRIVTAAVLLLGSVAVPAAANEDWFNDTGRATVIDSTISVTPSNTVKFVVNQKPLSSKLAAAWRRERRLSSRVTSLRVSFEARCYDQEFRTPTVELFAGNRPLSVLRSNRWEPVEAGSAGEQWVEYACDFAGFLYGPIESLPEVSATTPPTSASSSSSPPVTVAPTSSAPPPAVVGTVSNPVPFGVFYQLGGWRVRVLQVRDDSSAEVAAQDFSSNPVPGPGQRWMSVLLEGYRTDPSPQSVDYGLTVSMIRDGRVIPAGDVYIRNEAARLDAAQGTSVLFAAYFMVGPDLLDFNLSVLDDGKYPKTIGVFRSRV